MKKSKKNERAICYNWRRIWREVPVLRCYFCFLSCYGLLTAFCSKSICLHNANGFPVATWNSLNMEAKPSFPFAVWSFCQHLPHKCQQTLKPWTGPYIHGWLFGPYFQFVFFTLACFEFSLFSVTSEDVKPAVCCVTILNMAGNLNKPLEDPSS